MTDSTGAPPNPLKWPAALALLALLGLSGMLYTSVLDRVPPYLSLDEAHFAVHAHALSQTGRNLDGELLPLMVSLADPLGDQPVLPWGQTRYHPVLFYLIALLLQVAPLSEAAIRLPTALIGAIVNVALMYAIAFRLTRDRLDAWMAAAMLALCPAHFILSRQALDYVAPLPFILGWLWCLIAYTQTGRHRYAFAGGLLLGAGCYSYVTSWAMMPAYLALSWLVMRHHAGRSRAWLISAAGFALPVSTLAPWLWLHPEAMRNLLQQYQVADPAAAAAAAGMMDAVKIKLSIYWNYFNPSFLFVSGGSSRSVSTGRAGVFLMPFAVWLPAGVYAMWHRRDLTWWSIVLLAGLATAPIPAVIKGAPYATQRIAGLLPFAVLISALGWAWMWQSQRRWIRVAAALLAAAMVMQFLYFYRDYQGDYRERAGGSYDPTAFRGAAELMIAIDHAQPVPRFYLTAPLYDVSAKWRFYATKHGRQGMLARTQYFDGNLLAIGAAVPGSIAVVPAGSSPAAASAAIPHWTIERTITNLSGEPTLIVLRRVM